MVYRLIFLCFICPCSLAQDLFSNSVSLIVKTDSLFCKNSCNTVDVQLFVGNDSDGNILVYGLPGEGILKAPFELSEFCDTENTGTGIAFGIYSLDGKQQKYRIAIADHYGQKKVTKQVLDSALLVVKTDFINSAIVLRKHESRQFIKRIALKDFELKKGLYYLQIVYYSGDRISDVVDVNKVTQSAKAKLYRGCSFSTKVPLIIE